MKIAVIGCGKLGGALVKGLATSSNFIHELVVCDRNKDNFDKLRVFKCDMEFIFNPSAYDAVENADIVILMVRPNQVLEVSKEISSNCLSDTLIVSCAAGISFSQLEKALKNPLPIVRAMPNTALQTGRGSTALWYGGGCVFPRDKERIQSTFGVVGDLIQFEDEDSLHMATVLLGSAPAFFLYFMQGLIDAAVMQGLQKEKASQLAKASLNAASALLLDTDTEVNNLIMQIAGKGGVTEAGLLGLEKGRLKEVIESCVDKALVRSFNREI